MSADKKKILFVVNTISHRLRDVRIDELIDQYLDHDQFSYKIVYTQEPHHASELTEKGLSEGFDIVAAVGGDGTVNEVGKMLIDKPAALAIIPVGSGNGLAKHLGIPSDIPKAIQMLGRSRPIVIDTAKMNDRVFLCAAGIGFDAHIASEFSRFSRRGLLSYMRIALSEYPFYIPESYHIHIDGQKLSETALIVSFANSSQYGNHFQIAPQAEIRDGFLDIVIVKPIPFYAVPAFLYKFRMGSLHKCSYIETYKCREVIIKEQAIQAHVDGEPVLFHHEIKVVIQPASLKVLVSEH